jgi:hypothetical protein
MSWHGIGLISGNWAPLTDMGSIYTPPESIEPDAAWTGTAASGFASVPSDPERTTAKPAVRLLVPPYQYFTDTLDVGVIAMANEGGTLVNNFGIASVKFMFEGGEATVTEPTFQTIQTQRGPRTYFGWWTRLRKPAGKAGQAHLYIEATARDATMQKRVIGPYLFSPETQEFTHAVTVAPSQPEVAGANYQTLDAAATYVNQIGSANPLITITEPGLYELNIGSGFTGISLRTGLPGRLNITASVPGVSIGRATYENDGTARINDARSKLRFFGSNLSLDYRYVLNVNGSSADEGQGAWLDGVNMISTAPLGNSELWRGTIKPNGLGSVRGAAWFTEVMVSDLTNFGNTANLIRGCDLTRVAGDIFSNSKCCIQNRVRIHSGRPQSDQIDAFTIRYTGTEATTTLSRTGGQGASGGGVWIVDIGGTQYTFDTGQVEGNEAYYPGSPTYPPVYNGADGIGGYWFSDLVAWLNTLPGITATLLLDENDPLERRTAASGSLPGLASGGFSNQDIKTATLTVISHFNKHSDFYQHTAGVLENVIIAFNQADAVEAQGLFFSPSGNAGAGAGKELDFFAVGNAIGIGTEVTETFNPAGGYSQFGRGAPYGMVASHVVIAHNTLPNQGFWIRTNGIPFGSTADAYSMLKNNVVRTLFYDAEGPLPNLTIDALRIHSGNPKPAGATNVLVGGDETSLFVDFAGKDFRPAGQLAAAGFRAVIPHDMNRTPFPEFAALGAFALEAPEYVPPPPSEDPLGDLLAGMNTAGGQSSLHRLRNATVSSGVWRSEDMSANNNDLTQSITASQPAIGPTGATFDNGDRVSQTITGGTFTVIMGFTKADASTAATILCDQGSTNVVQYAQNINSAPGSTVLIDGNPIPNRNALYLALHQTGAKVIEMQGCNFTGDTQISLGRGGATSLVGIVDWFIVIDEAAFPDTLSQMRSWAKQVAASA